MSAANEGNTAAAPSADERPGADAMPTLNAASEQDAQRRQEFNYGERRSAEAKDGVRQYNSEILELRDEARHLEETLKNSSRLKLGWLRLTGKLSKDPRRDLDLLRSTLAMKEDYRASELSGEATTRLNLAGAMSKDQAARLLELMEDNNVRPSREILGRASQDEGVKASIKFAEPGHGLHPHALPIDLGEDELEREQEPTDADFGEDFEPPF